MAWCQPLSNGFLPGQSQGSILKADQREAIRNIPARRSGSAATTPRFCSSVRSVIFGRDRGRHTIEAAIRNYETAFRMQSAIPELCDISGETQETHKLYGLDSEDPKNRLRAAIAYLRAVD